MKALLAVIILFSCFNSWAQVKLPAEPPETTAGAICSSPLCPSEKLLGKIRYIANLDFWVRTDSMGRKYIVDTGYYSFGCFYDEYNNILMETYKFMAGKEEIYRISSYDDKLRLIKIIDEHFGGTTDSLIYNDIENTITRYQYGNLKQPKLLIYSFDKTGNLIRLAKQYTGSTYISFYQYDNKKRLITEILKAFGKDTAAHLARRSDAVIYEYIDKEDMKIVRKHKQMNGQQLLKTESITYLKNQTMVFREYSGPDDTVIDSVELDSVDSLVVTDTGSTLYWLKDKGKKIGSISHFDKNNRIVDFYYPQWLPDKTTYKYKLDYRGNWVEQRVFEDGELFHVRKRIIEYFE